MANGETKVNATHTLAKVKVMSRSHLPTTLSAKRLRKRTHTSSPKHFDETPASSSRLLALIIVQRLLVSPPSEIEDPSRMEVIGESGNIGSEVNIVIVPFAIVLDHPGFEEGEEETRER